VEYSGLSRFVQFGSRWKAHECSLLEQLIPPGKRNRRNRTACIGVKEH
jgi:hypothetical protein